MRHLIALLGPALLQRFAIRVLLERAVADDVLLEALARLTDEPAARALAATMQALWLAGHDISYQFSQVPQKKVP